MESSIGNRIKNKRRELRLTQNQLADKAFISASYLALIEADKRTPSTEVLKLLSEILGLSFDYLLFGNTDKQEIMLFNQWKAMTVGRTEKEIEAAQGLVKCFFENMDKLKNE